jgi:hypothetical protein
MTGRDDGDDPGRAIDEISGNRGGARSIMSA